MSEQNLISIIIPCSSKDLEKVNNLVNQVHAQKIDAKLEVHVIKNVSPAGRARNQGADKSKGDILVFLDADIILENENVLFNIAQTVKNNKEIGVAAASVAAEKNISLFEKLYVRDIPHCISPRVSEITDVWVSTSACCAVRRDVFFEVGKFNEKIPRGQDPEFSMRIRKAGYRTVLAKGACFYHPVPKNLLQLIKINFRNGIGASFVDVYYPELNVDLDPRGIEHESIKKNIIERIIRFLGYFFTSILKLKFLLLFAKISYLAGYFAGLIKHRIFKEN